MNSSKSNSQIDYMLSCVCSVIDHNMESVWLYNKEKNCYRKEIFLFQNLSTYFENRPFPALLSNLLFLQNEAVSLVAFAHFVKHKKSYLT